MPADLLPWWIGVALLAWFAASLVFLAGWTIAALIAELLDG